MKLTALFAALLAAAPAAAEVVLHDTPEGCEQEITQSLSFTHPGACASVDNEQIVLAALAATDEDAILMEWLPESVLRLVCKHELDFRLTAEKLGLTASLSGCLTEQPALKEELGYTPFWSQADKIGLPEKERRLITWNPNQGKGHFYIANARLEGSLLSIQKRTDWWESPAE